MVYTRIKQKKPKSIFREEKVDSYGFTQWYTDSEKRELQNFNSINVDNSLFGRLKNMTKKRLIMTLLVGGSLLMWLSMSIVSGIHSWKEFPANALWIKIIRTTIAIIFSPIYLFYIFLRLIIFKQYY